MKNSAKFSLTVDKLMVKEKEDDANDSVSCKINHGSLLMFHESPAKANHSFHSYLSLGHLFAAIPACTVRCVFPLTHVFPRLPTVECSPVLTRITRLPTVTSFTALTTRYINSALSTRYLFSRACQPLHLFPRLPPVTCFQAVAIHYFLSRACHPLSVFPRFPPVTCFPALATHYLFSRALHPLPLFPRLPLAVLLSAGLVL